MIRDDGLSGITPKPWSKRASLSPRRTYSAESKIKYKRKVHRWTPEDAERVLRRVSEGEEKKDFPLIWKVLNWIAEYLGTKLFTLIDLGDDEWRIFWYGINAWWQSILKKIFKDDQSLIYVQEVFAEKYKAAIDEWLRTGSREGVDALLERLIRSLEE